MNKAINLTRVGKSITDAVIRSAELRCGIRLPEILASFLKENNGGYPDREIFDYFDLSPNAGKGPKAGSSLLSHFLGIDRSIQSEDIVEMYKMFHERIPDGLMPIARDAGGNIVAIAHAGPYYGRIYFWDFGLEVPGYDKMPGFYYVSDSLTSFIDSLTERPGLSDREEVIHSDDLKVLHALLEGGYDIETEDDYGMTLLESAAFYNAKSLIEPLIQRGALRRDSAAKYAQESGHYDTAELIAGS
jgi:hypothetical protein